MNLSEFLKLTTNAWNGVSVKKEDTKLEAMQHVIVNTDAQYVGEQEEDSVDDRAKKILVHLPDNRKKKKKRQRDAMDTIPVSKGKKNIYINENFSISVQNMVIRSKAVKQNDKDVSYPLPHRELAKAFGSLTGYSLNRAAFSSFKVKFSNPEATYSIFDTGRIVVTGARSVSDARKQLLFIEDMIKKRVKVGTLSLDDFCIHTMTVTNIVYSFEANFAIDTHRLSASVEVCATYEAENFPGCIIVLDTDKRITSICFSTGKGIITGCRTKKEALAISKYLYDIILPFKTSLDKCKKIPKNWKPKKRGLYIEVRQQKS